MLWYKYWLDTRWAFYLGLALSVAMIVALMLRFPYDPTAWQTKLQKPGGTFGGAAPEVVAMLSNYRGYIWAHLFRNGMLYLWTLWAVMIGFALVGRDCAFGVSGLTPEYTLSLPVSRQKLLTVGFATGALELTALSIVSSLALLLLTPLTGHPYPVTDAVVYALLMTAGSVSLFSLSFLLMTIFKNWWIGFIIAIIGLEAFYIPEVGIHRLPQWNLFHRVMSGEGYFMNGEVPLISLTLSLALAAAMIYLSIRIFERRDY